MVKGNLSNELSIRLVSVSNTGTCSYESDTYVILLEEDALTRKEDFVYFNSEIRNAPFDNKLYRNRISWFNATCPMSTDGSVLIELDSFETEYFDISDEYEALSELCIINLTKVAPRYNKLIVGFALDSERMAFYDKNDFLVVAEDNRTKETIA